MSIFSPCWSSRDPRAEAEPPPACPAQSPRLLVMHLASSSYLSTGSGSCPSPWLLACCPLSISSPQDVLPPLGPGASQHGWLVRNEEEYRCLVHDVVVEKGGCCAAARTTFSEKDRGCGGGLPTDPSQPSLSSLPEPVRTRAPRCSRKAGEGPQLFFLMTPRTKAPCLFPAHSPPPFLPISLYYLLTQSSNYLFVSPVIQEL